MLIRPDDFLDDLLDEAGAARAEGGPCSREDQAPCMDFVCRASSSFIFLFTIYFIQKLNPQSFKCIIVTSMARKTDTKIQLTIKY